MKRILPLLVCLLCPIPLVMADPTKFIDPLDEPAPTATNIKSSTLMGVASAGDRLVAVGSWGRILLSDTNGQGWKQASSPVSSDLTAVFFPTATAGWAVGHDGVVLHSADGGATWAKQLDGRSIAALLLPYYNKLAEQQAPGAADILEEMNELASEPPAFPLLDVWFRNDQEGFVVGAFNLILHTADGGKSWQPWMERTDNPRRYHLHSIRGNGKNIFIAGELGLILKLDEQSHRFVEVPSPYNGTFFGIVAHSDRLVAFGLRGNAFESFDVGQSWQKLRNHSESTLVAGTVLQDGSIVLVDQDGLMSELAVGSSALRPVVGSTQFPTFSIANAPGANGVVLTGPAGVRNVPRSGT